MAGPAAYQPSLWITDGGVVRAGVAPARIAGALFERRVVVQFGDGCVAVTDLLEGTVPGACGGHVGIEAVLETEVGD